MENTVNQTSTSTPNQPQPWTKEVARLLAIGYSKEQISVQTGVSLDELVDLMKTPVFKELSKQVSQDILDSTVSIRLRLEMAASSALDTIIDLMRQSRSDVVRRLCANDILDRAGHSIVQKHEAVHTVVIDDKRADLILQTSREIAPLEQRQKVEEELVCQN